MLTVTQEFKDALTSPIRQVAGYIVLQDGTQVLPSGDLQSYQITGTGEMLKTAMNKITISLLHEYNLKGQAVTVFYGVAINGVMEYVQRGVFQITDVDYQKDTGTTQLTGYDNMLLFQVPYTPVGEYPMTLYDYLVAICSLAGVTLENDTIYDGSLQITGDYYQNISDYTVRDVLEDVCEAAASFGIINSGGNLELRRIEDSGEILTPSQLKTHQIGEFWGGINSLVFSRQPQNDNVYTQDETDISSPTTKNILDLNKFNVGYTDGSVS